MPFRHKFSSLFLAAAIVAPVGAQSQDRTIERFRFYKMKPDRSADFEAAATEIAGLHKKRSDARDYTVWISQTGERELLRIDLYSKYAELDAAEPATGPGIADMARLTARITDCTESMRTVIAEIHPEVSLPLGDPPPMIELNRLHLQPGKGREFLELVRTELLPINKQAGTKFYVARVGFGESGPEALTVVGRQNWAAFDDASVESSPEYQHYQAKRNTLITGFEGNLYRFRPDLSYLPATKMSAHK